MSYNEELDDMLGWLSPTSIEELRLRPMRFSSAPLGTRTLLARLGVIDYDTSLITNFGQNLRERLLEKLEKEKIVGIEVGDKIRSKSGTEYFVGSVKNGLINAGLLEHNPYGWTFIEGECEKVVEKTVEFQVGDKVSIDGEIIDAFENTSDYVSVRVLGLFGNYALKSSLTPVESPEKEIPFGTQVNDGDTGIWVLGSSAEKGNVWVRIRSGQAEFLGETAYPSVSARLDKIARESL